MTANDSIRNLIDSILVCDDQPSEEQMTQLRKSLEHKVTTMKHRARFARHSMIAGIVLFALGYAFVAITSGGQQNVAWLTRTGIGILIAGAIVIVAGAVGLFMFRGFGYVWARHDLHDAAVMELSLQVQRLAQQIEAFDKNADANASRS